MKCGRIKIMVFLFLMILIPQAECQDKIKISGIVVNAENDKLLPYANVKVLETNFGTSTNGDGKFELTLLPSRYKMKISHVGFESRIIEFRHSEENIIIKLNPAPIEFEPVEIYAGREGYSWAELFVLEAIKKKNSFLTDLDRYRAFAYSKTGISSADSAGTLFTFIEAVSEINFIPPYYYSEKVLDLKLPRILKNIPYEDIGIKLNADLDRDELKLQRFSIVSPLAGNALDYYEFKLNNETLLDTDTLVVLSVIPKTEFKPLFRGELTFFRKSHLLVEARLDGNSAVADGFIGSLSLYQRYDLKGEFNVPAFSKIRMRMNLSGMRVWISQENTFIDYLFNENAPAAAAVLDKRIIFEPDIHYAVDSTRSELFHVPLTNNEVKTRNELDSLYTDSPFLLKTFLVLITDIVPLLFDKPATVGGIKISRISNWYHFDKIGGHFLGAEYQFFNDENLNLYGRAGYAFGSGKLEFDARLRWKYLIAETKNETRNLGGFPYNKIYNSLATLFTHEDFFNYFFSRSFSLAAIANLSPRWNISCGLNFEAQKPLGNSTEFSLFNAGRKYQQNFRITENRNNAVNLGLDYVENNNYSAENLVEYRGGSFLNASVRFQYFGKILSSSENRPVFDFSARGAIPIYGPAAISFFTNFHFQGKTALLQNMNFLNRYEPLMVEESPLTFYTTDNYKYFAENYFRVKSDINLYNLPGGSSFGMVVSYLHSFGEKSKIDGGDMIRVKNNFVEYGLFVKGLTYINFYVMVNNMDVKKPLFFFTFYL